MVRRADLCRTQEAVQGPHQRSVPPSSPVFQLAGGPRPHRREPHASIKPLGLDEKTVPVVTEDQVRDLLTLADPALARTPAHRFRLVRDRALLYTLWDTPGRLAEIARLRLDDVDLTNGTLLVMGKGRKERRMPIGDAARSVVWDYLQERESLMPRTSLLWVSEQGEALLPNGISQVLKRLGKRAGIADLRPHRFRHSYAVNALRAGMPGAGPENSRRLEENTGDLLQDIGRGGRQAVSPAGEPWGPARESGVCWKGSAAAGRRPAQGQAVRFIWGDFVPFASPCSAPIKPGGYRMASRISPPWSKAFSSERRGR